MRDGTVAPFGTRDPGSGIRRPESGRDSEADTDTGTDTDSDTVTDTDTVPDTATVPDTNPSSRARLRRCLGRALAASVGVRETLENLAPGRTRAVKGQPARWGRSLRDP